MKQFNKNIEEKKLSIKQNKNAYIKRLSISLSCLILVCVIILFTFAKFETSSEEYTLINGKILDSFSGDLNIAVKINGQSVSEFPERNSSYALANIECTDKNGPVEVEYNSETWRITGLDVYNKTKCIFNFYEKEEWTFEYSGTEKTFIPSKAGLYKLEVWGAQGGAASSKLGGYGGYSVGIITLEPNENLFINVGGSGTDSGPISPGNYTVTSGGYNGGGDSILNPQGSEIISIGSGGGATSISTRSGILSSLEQYKGTLVNNSYYVSDSIVIVAGGGGGAGYFTSSNYGAGGSGGGFIGVNGSSTNGVYGTGGTQIEPGYETGYSSTHVAIGSFGKGAVTGCDSNNKCWGGTGGGGFYGGGGTIAWHYTNGGGGGSGYIASSRLSSNNSVTKHMSCYNCSGSYLSTNSETKTIVALGYSNNPQSDYAKEGNGYAKITYLGQ